MARKYTQEIPKKRQWDKDVNQQIQNLDEALQPVENEVIQARKGQPSLKGKIDLMDNTTDAVRTEVEIARGNHNTLGQRLDTTDTKLNDYTKEVSAARGVRSSLNDRLSAFLDPQGNPLLSQLISQFFDPGDTWSLVTASQIKTPGDQTGKYLPGYILSITDDGGDKYCQIDTATYDAIADETTVSLTEGSPALSGTISAVKVGIVSLDFGLVESVGQLFKYVYDLYNRVTNLEGKI